MPVDRASFQLQNIIFPHSHHYWLYIFACDKQDPACCTLKNLDQRRQPTFLQLQWQRHEENVAYVVHLSLAQTDLSQKVPNQDSTVGVEGHSS
jgi:hypothetical protein